VLQPLTWNFLLFETAPTSAAVQFWTVLRSFLGHSQEGTGREAFDAKAKALSSPDGHPNAGQAPLRGVYLVSLGPAVWALPLVGMRILVPDQREGHAKAQYGTKY